ARQSAREQGAAGRGARRLRIARREPEAASGEIVDRPGGRAHGHAAAVATEISPADVVEEDDEEVGPAPGARGMCRKLLAPRLRLLRENEGRLSVRGDADGRTRDRVERWHAPTICGAARYFKRPPDVSGVLRRDRPARYFLPAKNSLTFWPL